LKGLLRDSYRELFESALAEAGLPDGRDLFGDTGKLEPGPLRIENACLDEADQLGPWLLWVCRKEKDYSPPFQRADVIRYFTEIRRQTAIDRKYARPLQDSLRATRTLRAGLVFRAIVGELAPPHRDALALAAAGLQAMGSSRTRGMGEVRCWLEEQNGDGSFKDLTAPLLERLNKSKEARVAGDSANAPAALAPEPEVGPPGGDLYQLRFRIQLRAPAVFPKLAGDPFTVYSHDYIPGSTIRGVLAQRYLARHGDVANRDRFQHLFCGSVAFLPAYPVHPNTGAAAHPVPHSIRKYKDGDVYLDLARQDYPEDEQLERVRGWAPLEEVQQRGTSNLPSNKLEVAADLHYHHARPADRRVQRALGERDPEKESEDVYGLKEPDRGALFTYESVRGGQIFSGALVGSQNDLEAIQMLVVNGETVRAGRSKGAQYGSNGEWEWIDAAPVKLEGSLKDQTEEGESRIIVTLTTPLIGLNEYGHPAPEFSFKELAAELGFPSLDLRKNLIKSFVRVDWQGAYLNYQKLPRQQMPALQAGSVFVVELPEPPDAQMLAKAAGRSYGLRTEDGFGRVNLRLHRATDRFQLFPSDGDLVVHAVPAVQPADQKAEEGGPRWKLALEILRRQIMEHAEALGIEVAANTAKSRPEGPFPLDRIHTHLLSRLVRILEQNPDLNVFAANLRGSDSDRKKPGELRDTARRQLERCRVAVDKSQPRLLGVLVDTCEKAPDRFDKIVKDVWGEQGGKWASIFPDPNRMFQGDHNFAQDVVRRYLRGLLTGLALEKRAKEKQRQKEGSGRTKEVKA
jgi:CRISPR-associated protein Csx10